MNRAILLMGETRNLLLNFQLSLDSIFVRLQIPHNKTTKDRCAVERAKGKSLGEFRVALLLTTVGRHYLLHRNETYEMWIETLDSIRQKDVRRYIG